MPHEKKLYSAKKELLPGLKGGVSQVGMSFFGGAKVRVDEKWTWGEGGSKKAENGWTSFVQAPLAINISLSMH